MYSCKEICSSLHFKQNVAHRGQLVLVEMSDFGEEAGQIRCKERHGAFGLKQTLAMHMKHG